MEQIICAAVMAEDGRIFRCHRHNHGFMVIHMAGSRPLSNAEAQGFVTSENRYVGRKEALKIQEAAGIKSIQPGGYRGDELFSEDLY